jgi:RNA polymerase sigma factor (sigma-70 family)
MGSRDYQNLFRQHEGVLLRVCERIVGERDAEDIVQETLIRAITLPPDLRDERAWLVTVARNLALNHLRRSRRVEVREGAELDELADDTTEDAPLTNPETALDAREAGCAAALVAIEILPPTERSIVLLRDLMDLSAAETAAVLGLTAASVRVMHHRARKTLAQRRSTPPADGRAGATESSIDALERFVTWMLSQAMVAQGEGGHERLLGAFTVHLALIDAVLSAAVDAGRPALHARALLCRGNILRLIGRLQQADDDLALATEIADRAGEPQLAARCRVRRAAVLHLSVGSERSHAELDAALGQPSVAEEVVLARTIRAHVLLHQGRWADAARELIALERGVSSDTPERVHVLNGLGMQHIFSGRYDLAIATLHDAKDLAERVSVERLATVLCNLGVAYTAIGDHEAARAMLSASLVRARANGNRSAEGMAFSGLADIARDQGELATAVSLFQRAHAIQMEAGNKRSAANDAFHIAVCEQIRGHVGTAYPQMMEAARRLEAVGHHLMRPPVAAFLAGARAELGLPQAAEALSRAREVARADGDCAYFEGVIDTLEGLLDLHRGDVASVETRLAVADPRWPEARMAIAIVSAARDRADIRTPVPRSKG